MFSVRAKTWKVRFVFTPVLLDLSLTLLAALGFLAEHALSQDSSLMLCGRMSRELKSLVMNASPDVSHSTAIKLFSDFFTVRN